MISCRACIYVRRQISCLSLRHASRSVLGISDSYDYVTSHSIQGESFTPSVEASDWGCLLVMNNVLRTDSAVPAWYKKVIRKIIIINL